MILTPEHIKEARRELAKRSLAEFARQAWHVLEPSTELKWGWALDAICEHLEAVTHGDLRRLLINVPPGSMKSLLTSVIWPAWEWGPRDMAETRYIGTAHAQHLAVRDNLKCRRLITSKWYQGRWPVTLTGDQNAKTKFENDRTGFREAMSFTGMTGARGDRVILDDPHSVDDANSQVKLATDIVTFREALPSRVNNERSAIVIIMQRLNEGDVSAVAKEFGYEHLCIPMRFEPDRRCTTSIGWTDPRTKDGDLMFPERFPEQQVQELEKSLGSYATAGQLQQRPAPRGGGVLKDAWWQYASEPPLCAYRNIYADTAQKTGEENDWSVFQLWGRTVSGQAILLDMIRGKWEAPELLSEARAFYERHRLRMPSAPFRSVKIEDKVSGTGLIQTLARDGVPVVPIKRHRDKLSRAHDVAPFIESGNAILLRGVPHLDTFLAEASAFPYAAHDDTVDPMLDAITDIMADSGEVFGVL